MKTLWGWSKCKKFLSVIEDLIKEDVYAAVGRKNKVDIANCWATIPDSLK